MTYLIEFDLTDPSSRRYIALLISEIERNRQKKTVEQIMKSDAFNIAFEKISEGAYVIFEDCQDNNSYISN